jgi:hypothetical protein
MTKTMITFTVVDIIFSQLSFVVDHIACTLLCVLGECPERRLAQSRCLTKLSDVFSAVTALRCLARSGWRLLELLGVAC